MDPQWSKEHGIQCAAFYHLDEKGLYDPCKYIFGDEAKLTDKECSVLVFHPGYLDQYLLDHSSYTLIRPMETAFLCSDALKEWMQQNQVELMTFTGRVREFWGKDGQ